MVSRDGATTPSGGENRVITKSTAEKAVEHATPIAAQKMMCSLLPAGLASVNMRRDSYSFLLVAYRAVYFVLEFPRCVSSNSSSVEFRAGSAMYSSFAGILQRAIDSKLALGLPKHYDLRARPRSDSHTIQISVDEKTLLGNAMMLRPPAES